MPGLARLGFGLYNTCGEVDVLIEALDFVPDPVAHFGLRQQANPPIVPLDEQVPR